MSSCFCQILPIIVALTKRIPIRTNRFLNCYIRVPLGKTNNKNYLSPAHQPDKLYEDHFTHTTFNHYF